MAFRCRSIQPKTLRAVDPTFVLHIETGPGAPGNIAVEEGEFAGGAEVASHLAPQTLFLVPKPPDDAQVAVLGAVPKSIGHWAFHSAAVFELQDLQSRVARTGARHRNRAHRELEP